MDATYPEASSLGPPHVPPRNPSLVNRGNFERAFAAIRPILFEHARELTGHRAEAERLIDEVKALAFSERRLLGRRESFAAWCEARMRAHHAAALQRHGHDPHPPRGPRPYPGADDPARRSAAERGRARAPRLRVADVMTTPAFVVTPEASAAEAGRVMRERSVRHVPVVDDEGMAVGMITAGDLARIGVWADLLWPERDARGEEGGLGSVSVGDVMSSPVRCVYPEDSLSSAAALMTGGKRHALPVVTRAAPRAASSEPGDEPGNRILGVVTANDLLRAAFLVPPR